MRSVVADQAFANDYVTPHEYNAEVAELVDTWHGLDRDNVSDGILTHAKVALDAWNVMEEEPRETTRQTSHGESVAKGQIHGIPNEAGTGTWSLSITTGDGVIECGVSVGWFKSAPAGTSAPIAVGVRVNGIVVAWSPMDDQCERGCPLVDGVSFVGAGTHLVEAVFLFHSAGAAGVTQTIDWLPGLLWARGPQR